MAQSIEIGVPLDRARDAVDAVIEQADRRGYLHTSPFGVRFVGPSPHVLSFAAGTAPICAIEIPLLTWQDDCDTILEELELLLCSTLFRGRPHWGQMHHMDGARARAKYGAGWDRWVHYYRRWNASGMFSNAFTEQLNLDLWWQGGSTT